VTIGTQNTSGNSFTDGLLNGSLASNEPTALMDSVEVLKGPASILTGTQVGGGLINYVPKRANGVTPADFTLGTGTGAEAIGSADVSAAVPYVDHLYFRTVGFAQHADRNPGGGDAPYQLVLSPMLGYRSDTTTLDLAAQYFAQSLAFTRRDYINGNGQITSWGGAYNPHNRAITDFAQVNYNVEQSLVATADWAMKLRAKGLYQEGDNAIETVTPVTTVGALYEAVGLSVYIPQHTTSHYIDLYNKFHTGPIEHQLIVAGDYNDVRQQTADSYAITLASFSQQPTIAPVPRTGPRSTENTIQYGAVIQDQLSWWRLHALIAGRESWYHDVYTPVGGGDQTIMTQTRFTPSFGLVGDLTKAQSVYFNYSDAFTPTPSSVSTVAGARLPPAVQKRYETGYKGGFFSDRLDLNGSFFWYSTTNSARTDPLNPSFFVAGPGYDAVGVELSTTGSVSATLKIIAGYTYTNGHAIPTNGNLIGGALFETPRNVANLWVVKTLKLSNDSGVDVGFGGNFYDGFYLDEGRTQDLVKFDRQNIVFNGALAYRWKNYRANLTVDNLANRRNYGLSGATFQLVRAPPTTFRFVLSARY
jgi:outer membrane receptor protein involved in Fe transport